MKYAAKKNQMIKHRKIGIYSSVSSIKSVNCNFFSIMPESSSVFKKDIFNSN